MTPVPPPPLPVAGPAKKKLPGWVWGLTIGGFLFALAVGGGMYSMFRWASNMTKSSFEASNPSFEYLRLAGEGKVRVRHKPTGREFLVRPVGSVQIVRALATEDVDPPDWTKLPGAKWAKSVWEVGDDVETLRTNLAQTMLAHDYRIEWSDNELGLTGCDAKTLRCVTFASGAKDSGAGSWYSVRATAVK